MATFKITISKRETVRGIKGREWQRVDATPESKYDYTPEYETDVVETTQIFEQTVDELDLPSVIKAINRI